MAKIIACGSCIDRGPTEGDCTCIDCVTGGQQCLPNNPKNRTAQMLANSGLLNSRRSYSNSGRGAMAMAPSRRRSSRRTGGLTPTPKFSYRRFSGGGQTPLNVQPQWSNDGTRDQVFVGMDGSSEGYGSIFSQKNYWIGVVAGVVGLMVYQKYVK